MPRRQNLRRIPKDMPRKQKVPVRLTEVKQSYLWWPIWALHTNNRWQNVHKLRKKHANLIKRMQT